MQNPYFTTGKDKIIRLMKTALGELPADIAIKNGDVVNVYTGELLPRQTVLVKGNTIAYVGTKVSPASIGPGTEVIDAAGKTLIPGFIDGHTHVEEPWPMEEFAKYALKSGTTTVITETADIGTLMGYRGMTVFMKMCRNQPIRFLFTIPPVVRASPANTMPAALTPEQLKRLLRRPEVLGLGELPWNQANENYPRLLENIAITLNIGKKVEGHSAGGRGNKLQAYFANGTSSCHEPITVEETLERLRLGVFVMVREGVVRKELGEVAKIKDEKIDFTLLGICSDGVDPRQFVHQGYMDFIVQKLVNYGFAPVRAIQMATINVARHFGLDFVGGIAPGKLADIAIIPDLKTIKPTDVLVNGEIKVRHGQLTAEPAKTPVPRVFRNIVRLKRDLSPADFRIRVPSNTPVKVRAIAMATGLITREANCGMTPVNGLLEADVSRDILKVAVIERYYEPGKKALGFIRGFRLKRGAIATSTLWDGGNIGVIGTNDTDMAQAVNRIRALQGGTIVCADGKILAELALPIIGLSSDQSMEFIAGKFDEIQQAAESLGTKLPMVLMSLRILSTPFIPFFRISQEGYFDVSKNELVGLLVE
ncbi:MAG: adenine deaminase [Dehalococcoidales bacterium]|nr:adenine deaminase [Dehalococcoidales bacterium]